MTEIKLTKRYPLSRTEDITDAYMRGWNDALDAVQNGKFHIAEQTEPRADCVKCVYYKECTNNNWADCGREPTTEDCSMVDPLHDDCFDCDKFFICDDKGDDYKTDCAWK